MHPAILECVSVRRSIRYTLDLPVTNNNTLEMSLLQLKIILHLGIKVSSKYHTIVHTLVAMICTYSKWYNQRYYLDHFFSIL